MSARHQPTAERRRIVARLAKMLPHQQIARVLGIGDATLTRDYRQELDQAEVAVRAAASQSFIFKMLGGHPDDWEEH
jgi:hypothetical protein